MDKESFYRDVYSIVREIPRGRVATYKQIAVLTGYPMHSRLAGRALSEVPADTGLPCHRVVSSQGRTAPAWPAQRGLLMAEGVVFRDNGCVDMKRHKWVTESM